MITTEKLVRLTSAAPLTSAGWPITRIFCVNHALDFDWEDSAKRIFMRNPYFAFMRDTKTARLRYEAVELLAWRTYQIDPTPENRAHYDNLTRGARAIYAREQALVFGERAEQFNRSRPPRFRAHPELVAAPSPQGDLFARGNG